MSLLDELAQGNLSSAIDRQCAESNARSSSGAT